MFDFGTTDPVVVLRQQSRGGAVNSSGAANNYIVIQNNSSYQPAAVSSDVHASIASSSSTVEQEKDSIPTSTSSVMPTINLDLLGASKNHKEKPTGEELAAKKSEINKTDADPSHSQKLTTPNGDHVTPRNVVSRKSVRESVAELRRAQKLKREKERQELLGIGKKKGDTAGGEEEEEEDIEGQVLNDIEALVKQVKSGALEMNQVISVENKIIESSTALIEQNVGKVEEQSKNTKALSGGDGLLGDVSLWDLPKLVTDPKKLIMVLLSLLITILKPFLLLVCIGGCTYFIFMLILISPKGGSTTIVQCGGSGGAGPQAAATSS